jgi:hypothetical protein
MTPQEPNESAYDLAQAQASSKQFKSITQASSIRASPQISRRQILMNRIKQKA